MERAVDINRVVRDGDPVWIDVAVFRGDGAPSVAKLLANVAADFVRAVFSCYYLVVIDAGALAAILLAFSRPDDAALLVGVARSPGCFSTKC